MGLQEAQLHAVAGLFEEGPQVPQSKEPVIEGVRSSVLQVGDGVIARQMQETLQRANGLDAAPLQHRDRPRGARRPENPAAAEQVLGAALDGGDLMGMDMVGVGREATGFGAGVDADLLHLEVKDAHEPRLGAYPQLPADKLRGHGIVRLLKLDVAVAVNRALGFGEAGKQISGKWSECGPLRGEELGDLLLDRAVNARVGHGRFPLHQELVLLRQARKLAAPEGIFLDVVDSGLDLALMAGHGGLGGGQDGAVVPAEVHELGIEIGVEPVGLQHGRLQIIRNEACGDAAKVSERVFRAPDERLRILAPDRLRVALPGMAQDRAEDMGPAPPAVRQDPGTLAEVDLQLLARGDLHPPVRQLVAGRVAAHKALYRLVGPAVALLPQVLVNANRGQALGDALDDRLRPGLAAAARAGGHFGWF